MRDALKLIWWGLIGLFRSRASLEAENLVLRHQLNVLRRRSPKRLAFSNLERLIFACLYAVAPCILKALTIVEPQTVTAGIGLAFACSGIGSRNHAAADRGCRSKFAG